MHLPTAKPAPVWFYKFYQDAVVALMIQKLSNHQHHNTRILVVGRPEPAAAGVVAFIFVDPECIRRMTVALVLQEHLLGSIQR
jgi:hypothetical protein